MTRRRASRKRNKMDEPAAMALIGEAIHLLRQASAATLACYLTGSVPFVMGMLFFLADMSRSPFAYRRCAAFAFGMALLFVWMKLCHLAFAARLRACRSQGNLPAIPLRVWARTAASQAFIHATGFLVLPVALVASLPFPWAYAFYQNVAVTPVDADPGARATARRAWRDALPWPRQNMALITILTVFAFAIFLNMLSAIMLLPYLGKVLFGIQSPFTTGGSHMYNTTLLASAAAVAFLVVDPVVKTVYLLRGFYTASQHTGADLRTALHRLRQSAVLIALVVLGAGLGFTADAAADEATGPVVSERDSEYLETAAADLDVAIDKTIEQPEYAWRMPRDLLPEEEDGRRGLLADFALFLSKKLVALRDTLSDIVSRLARWLRRLFPERERQSRGFLERLGDYRSWIWLTLIAVVVVVLVILVRRLRKHFRGREEVIQAEAVSPVPDLTREDVTADELPEEEWLRLAADLLGKGDYRLGLRALFLASLAALARRHLVVIARFKSDRDYELELARRAHAVPGVVTAFSRNVGTFERIWYGYHQASEEAVTSFRANLDIILGKADGSPIGAVVG